MECSQIRAILFENADTEIPMEFREGVEAHLAVCRSCAMQLEALREQAYALGTLPKVEPPAGFLDQVRSRVGKPSVFSMLKQAFSGSFAGKRFFRLAGAAAAAALVIITVQVALRDDGSRKVLLSPAPSAVELLPSTGSPPSAEAPPAQSASPGSLPDNRGKNEKAFNTSTSPVTEPHRPAGNGAQSVVLTLKSPGVSAKAKTRGGSFKPESVLPSSPGATGMGAPGERRLKRDVSKGVAGSAKVSEGASPPEAQNISSDVVRLIERANGKVLSAGPARDANQPETLLAEMPAVNYPSFLDQLRQLGEVESNGDKEFSPAPDAKVRVSVSFETN